MPRGYRYVILAAVAGLSLANAEQHYRPREQRQEQHQTPIPPTPEQLESDAGDKPGKGCEGTTKPRLSCEAISAQAGLDQARDADEQAHLSGWQTGVGALTLIAAVFAAIFAWRAAYHTKRGADSAAEGVKETGAATELMRRTFKIENRPWLEVKSIAVQNVRDIRKIGATKSFILEVELIFKNAGNKPVRYVDTRLMMTKSIDMKPGREGWPDSAAANGPVWILNPGETAGSLITINRTWGDKPQDRMYFCKLVVFYAGFISSEVFDLEATCLFGSKNSGYPYPSALCEEHLANKEQIGFGPLVIVKMT